MDIRSGSFTPNGFTLIELILVIVITGIIAGMISIFISKPMEGYVAVSNRAELVNAADSALQMMARDIRQALPNSIRCNTSGTGCNNAQAIEMLHTIDGVRYRASADPANGCNPLVVSSTSTITFDTIGYFRTTTGLNKAYLVIYNLDTTETTQPGYNAYIAPSQPTGTYYSGNITPANDINTIVSNATCQEDTITLNQPQQFSLGSGSPHQRLFVVDGPVSYQCAANGILYRDSGYPISANFPTFPTSSQVPLTEYVTGCHIDYLPGTATRGGLVTMSLTLTKAGESVTLLHQVHVDNSP